MSNSLEEWEKAGMPVTLGATRKLGKLEFVWWGRSQWYKWRWFGDHIDLGSLSIYNLTEKGIRSWPWRALAFAVKPMRWTYHRWLYRRWPFHLRSNAKND